MASNVANTANPGTFASLLGGVGNTTNGGNPTLLGTGGTGGILGSIFGQIPGVANPTSGTGGAIAGNIGDLTGNANLTQGLDTIGAAGAALPFDMNLPGYQSELATESGNVSQEQQGQLPADVVSQLQQAAAERGVATGQSGYGSPNINASYLQALGLTSLGQEQQGTQDFKTLIGETPTGVSANPSNMLTTPSEEQAANQAVQTAMAAPDPTASGIFSSIMSLI